MLSKIFEIVLNILKDHKQGCKRAEPSPSLGCSGSARLLLGQA
jgi:hypothetical protein